MLSVDDFWQQYAHQPYQLIDGQVIHNVRTEYLHEIITSRTRLLLSVYAEQSQLGDVFGDGVCFALDAYNCRRLDVAYVSQQHLATITDPEGYLPFAPEIAIQVVSARYTSNAIQQAADCFLRGGSQIFWIVDPIPKSITALYADGGAEVLTGEQRVRGYDALPGFEVVADDFFPPLETKLSFYS